ncbi:endoplasmic reticulum membrane-associated RNA degradation protein-like [Acanthaster planci]|uniref:Endoplasmic reticulum membrane-associated RNA degradation protein-like n=1 Tax=Acanthaster planci TaxID=133434 RepID=A0A8B7XQC6_ACAPL|nr:endoplasmic reticulum membrane-associated RNA degradation protein-like [Acanthaster planci]XP_022083029.1 endoplasmic reticulum membrane-associated RNA degradation protein-like [Acanthaster planci]XP_022083030.1 endoplasmic reticulum membrane-associated RNA degradation protein-like [Acanthaster planci]XP_022083031.1 endoplasmic reticulum membrane-associated RNA degradation protein-like [Acanthaster planci]XP_022083032.1 endoplasmic reticulum membrane-associated RNA degradation protein-like [
MTTCLSPKKHRLVCDLGALVSPTLQQEDSGWLSHFKEEAGLLLWSCITTDGVNIDSGLITTESTYEDHVVHLAPYCHSVHEWALCLGSEDIQDRYEKHFEWTGNAKLFLDCFSMARSSRGVDTSLSILLSTAALERALGDVFLLKSNDPCPAMLKNLLATQELVDTFGESAISLLRILIGPPVSLNLRNILWHGFAAPDEIPQRYSTFLLIVTASLGQLLEELNIPSSSIPHREPLLLPQIDTEVFKQTFPDIHVTDLDHLLELFSTSQFFHKPMLPYCKEALDYFRAERYGITCVLLLPQLENGVRFLFAEANDCPERILTAESEYFTTFDEMLCPHMSDETVHNVLIPTLGDSYMEMLLDILAHPEGPRLRDHISHGELDLQSMTRATAGHIISICAAYCLRDCQNQSLLHVPMLKRIRLVAEEYQSLFHPTSLLKRELLTFLESLSRWIGISRPEGEDLGYQTWSGTDTGGSLACDAARSVLAVQYGMPAAMEDIYQSVVMPFTDQEPLVKCISESTVKTLFRPRRELEVTSLLRRIVVHCVAVCRNVREMAELRYQQYLAKDLRSRQRANYTRLLNCVPRVSCGLRLIALILLCQLRSLHSIACLASKEAELLLKFLKFVLRCAENLNSLTSPEKNKWDECCDLTDSLQQRVKAFFAKLDKAQPST